MFKGCAIVLIGSWACKWHLDKNVRVYAFNTQRGVSEHSSRMHVLVHMAHWALWPLFIVFGWMKYSGKNVHCFNSLTDISCLLITCSSSEIFDLFFQFSHLLPYVFIYVSIICAFMFNYHIPLTTNNRTQYVCILHSLNLDLSRNFFQQLREIWKSRVERVGSTFFFSSEAINVDPVLGRDLSCSSGEIFTIN